MSSISPVSLKFAIPALAASLLMLAGGCDRQSGGDSQPAAQGGPANAATADLAGKVDRSHVGTPLPELTFRNPAGQSAKLSSWKGKPLLLNLWATWCAPCVAELPTLDTLAGREAGALKVLAVSEDIGEPAKVGEFLKSRKLSRIEPWLDPENDATMRLQLSTLPVTIFYGADGREKWRIAGGHDWTSAETASLLRE